MYDRLKLLQLFAFISFNEWQHEWQHEIWKLVQSLQQNKQAAHPQAKCSYI